MLFTVVVVVGVGVDHFVIVLCGVTFFYLQCCILFQGCMFSFSGWQCWRLFCIVAVLGVVLHGGFLVYMVAFQ